VTPEQAKEILDLPMMRPNDAHVKTIREYLAKLLTKVIDDGECFSGKRPFGNSGWENELHFPLVQAGLVKGAIEDGYLEDHDKAAAHKLILDVIGQVFS
jgi:hypothetical protein